MPSSVEVLQSRERLRVGRSFLRVRPRIAALGAVGNAGLLAASMAPAAQKLAVGLALGGTVAAFFAEGWWVGRRGLSERWLVTSLAGTLLALALGALLSGGLTSPFVPLFFAPVVVGYAAFARARPSWVLLCEAFVLLLVLWLFAPLHAFPELPATALRGMLWLSSMTSFVLLAVGVTALVDAQGRLARALDQLRRDLLLEAERRAKSVEHLGAQVAHEVKNPLAAARGLVQLVERHTGDERDKQRLSVVVTEVDRALAVLQDYLSFSRPLGDLSLAEVDLSELLSEVMLVLEARTHEKAVRLLITGEKLAIWADRQRLRDAVLNLALNALTALPRGGKLDLSTARVAGRAQLVVFDDGPGMSEQQLAELGKPFESFTTGGTGLGVLLAESVARQHGGTLRFDSAPGAGTRAILELPLGLERAAT